MQPIETLRRRVRATARRLATVLERLTGGRVHPAMITLTGLIAHLPIAVLIANNDMLLSAVLLAFFGLFDTLDGELARLQKRASIRGMLLDSITDRMKETLLYGGVAYNLAIFHGPLAAALAAVACGASVCVSYVQAKGEAAVSTRGAALPHDTLNRLFRGGLLTFEVRIVVLIIGLVFDQLVIAVTVIAVLASYTAWQRLIQISQQLPNEQA